MNKLEQFMNNFNKRNELKNEIMLLEGKMEEFDKELDSLVKEFVEHKLKREIRTERETSIGEEYDNMFYCTGKGIYITQYRCDAGQRNHEGEDPIIDYDSGKGEEFEQGYNENKNENTKPI